VNEEKQPLSVEEISALLPEGYALVEKDGWIPRQQAEDQLRAMTFDREVDLELTRCGAKSLTAARALLNLEELRQKPDGVRSEIGRIRKENDWLFQREPLMKSGLSLTEKRSVDTENMSDAEYYAYRKQMKGN
jgi:hypothetical protein